MLLCTDGLHNGVPDDQMAAILASAGDDLQQAADMLVLTAVEQDGSDNVSVVIARYSEP